MSNEPNPTMMVGNQQGGLPVGGQPKPPNRTPLIAGVLGGCLDLVADRLPIKIECNIHPWMNGWVRVFDHPYFAVTDADGNFELKNAPAGNYRLMVWHGQGGWRGRYRWLASRTAAPNRAPSILPG